MPEFNIDMPSEDAESFLIIFGFLNSSKYLIALNTKHKTRKKAPKNYEVKY